MKAIELRDRIHGPQAEIDYLMKIIGLIGQADYDVIRRSVEIVGSRSKKRYISRKWLFNYFHYLDDLSKNQRDSLFEYLDRSAHNLNICTNQAKLLISPLSKNYSKYIVDGVEAIINEGVLVADWDLLIEERPKEWNDIERIKSLGMVHVTEGGCFRDVETGADIDIFFKKGNNGEKTFA